MRLEPPAFQTEPRDSLEHLQLLDYAAIPRWIIQTHPFFTQADISDNLLTCTNRSSMRAQRKNQLKMNFYSTQYMC